MGGWRRDTGREGMYPCPSARCRACAAAAAAEARCCSWERVWWGAGSRFWPQEYTSPLLVARVTLRSPEKVSPSFCLVSPVMTT